VQRTYQKLCARTAQVCRRRHPSEGPQEYADAISEARPDLAAELSTLFTTYVQLRYDGRGDRLSLKKFQAAVERFKPGPAPV
jgi:hypothetical protein